MSEYFICQECGSKCYQLKHLENGKKVCYACANALDSEEKETKVVATWRGKIAKSGNRRYFNIPNCELGFLDEDREYTIEVK